MRDGDSVRVTTVRALGENPANWTTWAPTSKGDVFVMVCLGVEPKKLLGANGELIAEPLDRLSALRALGWVPEDEALVNATDEAIAAEIARRAVSDAG